MKSARKTSLLCRIGIVLFGMLAIGSAQALVINADFEGFSHGDIVGSIATPAGSIGVTANNTGGGPDLAVVMDSGFNHATGPLSSGDPDLVAPFGNPLNASANPAIAALPSNNPGKILIIQESATGCLLTCNRPDDEAGGGSLEFDFSAILVDGVTINYVDLLDIDQPGETVDITLNYSAGGNSSVQIPGTDIGDSRGARIDLATLFTGANSGVSSLAITFSGSGATGGFQISVPEPASLALLGIGLLGLGFRFARRRAG